MKSFVLIVIFVVAAMALVQVLDEYIPMGRGLSWSWVLYLIGGATIFLIYTRRLKSKGLLESKNDRDREDSDPVNPPELDRSELDLIRERIRRRKTDLRSKE